MRDRRQAQKVAVALLVRCWVVWLVVGFGAARRSEPEGTAAARRQVIVRKSGLYGAQAVESLFKTQGHEFYVGRSLQRRAFYVSRGTYQVEELAKALAESVAGELRTVGTLFFLSDRPRPGGNIERALAADLREGIEAMIAKRAHLFVSEDFWRRSGCPFPLKDVLERKVCASGSLDASQRAWLSRECGITQAQLEGALLKLRPALAISLVGYPDRGESRTSEEEGALVE